MLPGFHGAVTLLLLLLTMNSFSQKEGGETSIGIFTDCQYCDCPTSGNRYYSLSLAKLDSCVTEFNRLGPDAVFHLGDMIDHGMGSYDSVIPRFNRIRSPLHLVLGNHDHMVRKKDKGRVLQRAGIGATYYSVDLGGWTFIVLDGNDLSYFAPQTREQKQERNDMASGLWASFRLTAMPWNGGIGRTQLQWLTEKLDSAGKAGQKVILMCHFPLFAPKNHTLFNNLEVFRLISGYPCVKAWFSGHYHNGNYEEREGIHLLNFKGMVDTRMNAFSVVTLTGDSILVKGYGREPSRNLKIRK